MKNTQWEKEFGGQVRIDAVEDLMENGFVEQTANEAFDAIVPTLKSFISKQIDQAKAEERNRIVGVVDGMRKDAKWFEDNYFTAENAYPTYDKEKDSWVTITAKETYNQALSDIIKALTTKE